MSLYNRLYRKKETLLGVWSTDEMMIIILGWSRPSIKDDTKTIKCRLNLLLGDSKKEVQSQIYSREDPGRDWWNKFSTEDVNKR